ncbi:hypothetical protein AB0I28_37530 [Phytomonospora sp. NPDC050363]|uniref:WXG100 family type VII secretion target n=1 Tax=Phytomonospora sp. NPDC050363 TaxID=3155642 RepID=UPI0033E2DEF8
MTDLFAAFDSYIKGTDIGPAAAGRLHPLGVDHRPFAPLESSGHGWLTPYLRHLREPLDKLEGVPEAITAFAERWTRISATALAAASEYRGASTSAVGGWVGPAALAFQNFTRENAITSEGVGDAARAMAAVSVAGGVVVAAAREDVWGFVAAAVGELVAKLPGWLAEEGGNLATAKAAILVLALAAVAVWLAKITGVLRKLSEALRGFIETLKGLKDLIEKLKMRSPGGGKKEPAGPAKHTEPRKFHDRHHLNRIKPKSVVGAENTVVLPWVDAKKDLQDIKDGKAVWNPQTSRYEVNGRIYGFEPNGTLFPATGDGFEKLNRGEYKALQTIIGSKGDLETARHNWERASRNHPDMDASWRRALEIYKHHKDYKGGE